MATRLKDLRVEEISLVDDPASPGARAVFFKRKTSMTPSAIFSRALAVLMKRDSAPEEREAVAKELRDVLDPNPADEVDLDMNAQELNDMIAAAVTKAVAPVQAELAAIRKEFPPKKEGEEMTEEEKAKAKKMAEEKAAEEKAKSSDYKDEDMMKSLQATIAKSIKDATAPLVAEIAALKKQDATAGLRKQFGDVIKSMGMPEDKALAALEAMPEDARAEFAKGVRALAAQAKAAGIFKSFGSSAAPAGSAEAELDALAKAHQDKNPNMTFEQAYDHVCKTASGKALYERIIQGAN